MFVLEPYLIQTQPVDESLAMAQLFALDIFLEFSRKMIINLEKRLKFFSWWQTIRNHKTTTIAVGYRCCDQSIKGLLILNNNSILHCAEYNNKIRGTQL